jgi:polysaccharide biosynthesis transport protein
VRSRDPWQVLRRRWATVAVGTLLGLALGALHTLTATVTYRADASVFFSLTAGNSAADLVQGSTYAQNQVESFARLATTPAVLQPVVDELGLDESVADLAGQVDAAVPVGTVIVEVGVTDASPQRSARIANAVVASLTTVVEKIAPKDDEGEPTVLGTTVAPAEVPTSAASPDVLLGLAAGLVAGLVAGFGLGWLRESLDTRIRDADVLAEVTDRPVIGSVGVWSKTSGQVIVARAPHSPQAESFRQLRTNLQFLEVADEGSAGRSAASAVIAVTSSLAAEGKSTTATNLAVALAETGARVLLVDADLRRPSIATALGIEGSAGLTTVLSGRADVEDVVQEWGTHGLDVLASGVVPPNPAELLGSPAMHRLLQQLRRTYDYVVVDTAPLLPVTDAAVLSRMVDGTIVVADAGRVRRGQVAQALATLGQVSGRVLGVVLNRVRRDESSYEYRYDAGSASATEPVTASPESRVRNSGLPVGR